MKLHAAIVLIIISFIAVLTFVNPANKCISQENVENQEQSVEIQAPETKYLHGKILEILEEEDIDFQGRRQTYQKLRILITKGELKNTEIIVENGNFPMAQITLYHKGDNVIISYSKDLEGKDVFYITDYIRTNAVLILFIFFIVVSLVIGSKKSFFALISMIISFIILFVFILPQIQAGKDPVLTAILASIAIVPITFYMSHGCEKKTTVSILGTFIALIITGVLSNIFVNLTNLTGVSSEESMLLQTLGDIQYNLKGLLLAGIIIGTLGVMDDITIAQTAIVYQLHDLKHEMPFSELFRRSIQIGKDHIASMINTLILVYTGASLPLLLLFMNNPQPLSELINSELITTEIVRTLVGSIGLILAVPITTYLACYFVKRKETNSEIQ